MKFDTLMFDADDTLFDFYSSGKKCFTETAREFGFDEDKIDYDLYSDINQKLWDEYSCGMLDKRSVLIGRYVEYGERQNIRFDAEQFQERYEDKLADTCILYPETRPVLEKLKHDKYRIYIITNGVTRVQNNRLDLSGLRPLLDGIFISDEIGFAKPSDEYFAAVKKGVSDFDPKKTLIVGDSLVSDIPLGANNGIKTCRANYRRAGNPNNVFYDYEIFNLDEIFNVLNNNEGEDK